ncbi:MAG: hypothetical protein AAF806_10925 [Bacteroidota bacterium]
MRLVLSFLFLSFLAFNSAKAQGEPSPIEKMEDTLGVLSYAIVNAANSEQRFMACRSFIPMLTKALKTPNSFEYPFNRLKTISIQYPKDSTFRVFTWQLYVDSSEYRYFGAIQMNTPELQLIPLIDRSFQIEDLEYAQVDNKQWYGALYYNILDFDTAEGKKYLLFGYDGFGNVERYEENGRRGRALAFSHSDLEGYSKRKLIDVLTIKDGKAFFGAPVFTSNERPNGMKKSRIVLEYSAESKIVCNYDEFENAIIYDHLMVVGSDIPGGQAMQIPDGTFEGYKQENGMWVYVPKMFHTVVEEAPREAPVLDKEKDILGRKKQKEKL